MKRRDILRFAAYSLPMTYLFSSSCKSTGAESLDSETSAATVSNGLVWNLRYDNVPVFKSQLTASDSFESDAKVIQTWALKTLNDPNRGKFTVRGGGHSFIGASVAPNCAVLDMSPFSRVVIDQKLAKIRVGGGAPFIKILKALATLPEPSFIPSGDCPTVGIAGYLSGGGYGRLSPILGLGVDKVLELTALTFKKENNVFVSSLVKASPTVNPDLFWAMIGGGPRYAILVDVTLRYEVLANHSVVHLSAGSKSEGDFKKIFASWEDLLFKKLSPTGSLNLQLDRFHNMSCLGSFSNATGDRAAIEAFGRSLGAKIDIRPLTIENMEIVLAGCENLATCETKSWSSSKVYKVGKSRLIEKPYSLSGDTLSKIYQKIGSSSGDWAAYQFNPWVGAIKKANPNVSFPWRDFAYECQLSCDVYKKENWKDSNQIWVDEAASLLGDRKSAFFNHINRDILGLDKKLYFGASWDRLQTVKQKYDPTNVFPVFREGTSPR